jgi:uncharacterized OB-fold protein
VTDIQLPDRLKDVEAVRSVRTPAAIEFSYTPGTASSRYLKGIAQRKILGARVGEGTKVYVPPRGADPELGKPTTEEVEVADRGTLVSFCVVNVPFHGGTVEIPYTTGNILLDGSDQPIMHMIQECPVEKVRIGMRLEAVWVDDPRLLELDPEAELGEIGATMESIKWFRPLDEPDVDIHIPGEERVLWLDNEEFNR